MLGLDIAYMYANFGQSSFSRSRDMVGAHQNYENLTTPLFFLLVLYERFNNNYKIYIHPFQGWFAIRGIAVATINLSTKFEVSISTHYEDMKVDTKYRKWGCLR